MNIAQRTLKLTSEDYEVRVGFDAVESSAGSKGKYEFGCGHSGHWENPWGAYGWTGDRLFSFNQWPISSSRSWGNNIEFSAGKRTPWPNGLGELTHSG